MAGRKRRMFDRNDNKLKDNGNGQEFMHNGIAKNALLLKFI